MREDIMRQSNAERLEKDRSRKLTLQRQESLLSGRMPRAKTEGRDQDPSGRGAGIQVYHYKDPGTAGSSVLMGGTSCQGFSLLAQTVYMWEKF